MKEEFYAAAGNKMIPRRNKGVHVYLVHESRKDGETGCGALGHLNPGEAEHTVRGLWEGLARLGVAPQKFFGMPEGKLVGRVKKLGFPSTASERAKQILDAAVKKGVPTVVGVFSHEDGKITRLGSANIGERLPTHEKVFYSICSDARVPEEAAKRLYDKVKAGLIPGAYTDATDLIAPDAGVQKPSLVLVHMPEEAPNKSEGETFSVTNPAEERLGLDARLSIAYALVNFGPGGSDSLKKIVVTRQRTYNALTSILAGLKGVGLACTQYGW